jgi:hypothetical protein
MKEIKKTEKEKKIEKGLGEPFGPEEETSLRPN